MNLSVRSLLPKAVLMLCILLLNLTAYSGITGNDFICDTLSLKNYFSRDTISKRLDSIVADAKSLLILQKQNATNKVRSIRNSFQRDTTKSALKLPDKKDLLSDYKSLFHFKSKPLIDFKGGYVNYNLNYRSDLDTPYVQRNLLQHSVTGNVDLIIAELPLRISWLGRKSNSVYFRDIYDVRAEFNARIFRDQLTSGLQQKYAGILTQLKDSLTERLHLDKLEELKSLGNWLSNPFTMQKMVEMNEIIRIPAVSYDVTLPDTIARKRSDSLRSMAQAFMDLYYSKKGQYEKLMLKVDSLKSQYHASVTRFNRLKSALKGDLNNWRQFRQWKDTIAALSNNQLSVPKKYEWLMGIRNFSLGKSAVNHSELTAKNISINGLNFEYNSWYYFAITAGLIDFRFRDFSLQPFKRSPQYLYMIRAGIGELQRNYFIVSFLRGQKQLYKIAQDNKVSSYTVSGIAIEAKYQLSKHSYLIGEAAQSHSPSLRTVPATETKFWDLSDKSNKAFSIKLYSYLPRIAFRVEGMYKYTGANYQSFNSFQSNSSLKSWYVKAEQNFFKRQLRITASVRSNEFSNPYIVQAYSSNAVFKTIQASFRRRKWPAISIGYMPLSQLTKIDNQLFENRFHTLNASLNHIYKLGVKQASTFVFTRFYNNQPDTSFAFFNASAFVFTQNIFFSDFTALISISQTRNTNYLLNMLEGSLDIPLSRNTSIGIGSKLNSLNKQQARVGYSGKINWRFTQKDFFFLYYEKGYLPGRKNEMVRNDLANAGFIKYF